MVRLLCQAKTVIPHRAHEPRIIKVCTSCFLLLRRLLPSPLRVSIQMSSNGEDGHDPFHWSSWAFAQVTQNTCSSCEICSQLHQSTKNLGYPSLSCSRFLGNQGPAGELTKPQWDQVKPCRSVSTLSAFKKQETTPETLSLAKMPTQLPSLCVCRAPVIWAPQSRYAFVSWVFPY